MKGSPTELRNPRAVGIDEKSTEEVLRIISSEDRLVPIAVAAEIPRIAEAAEAVAAVLRGGGRVFFAGAGTSGRLGVMEAAEMAPTFGVPPDTFQAVIAGGPEAVFRSVEEAEDDEAAGGRALDQRGLGRGDILVALSASGRTPFVIGALRRARERGARTVAVTCNPGSPAAELADISIAPEVGAEVVAGSTRMKAGTAQKLVLNMLTTAAMIRLGKVHDGYMVGVQPSNRKLRERARRIVEALAGVGPEEAAEALEHAGGDVRVAVLLAETGAAPAEARRALDRAGGSLRRALEALR
ncbi:N-acetylmuramic acid 6-phosphate etherase [Candidatus Bathyarchaeota archaeon]|nr:MAG: N-acetylmuramic acid 6-phosphate etherase [Candidatus Bathyarchaeota archaeon]